MPCETSEKPAWTALTNVPTCRKVTPVPAGGYAQLPKAFHTIQLMEILNEHKKAAIKEKPYFCPDHDEKKVDLYCETCGQLICWKCIKKDGKHCSHDYEEFDDSIMKFKREITALLEPMENELMAVAKSFDECHEKISSQRTAIEANIHSSIKRLQDLLDNRQAKLISRLDQIIQNKVKNLTAQRTLLETTQAEVLQLKNESHEEGYHEELLMKKASILNQAKELTAAFQSDVLKPTIDADVKFTRSVEVIAQCQY